jgi:ATP-binding cassette subfamily B protein
VTQYSTKKKEATLANISARQVFSSYWHVLRKYKLLVGAMIACSVATNIIALIVPLYYKNFFDIVTAATDPSQVIASLLRIIVIIFGFEMAGWAAGRVMNVINNYYQSLVMPELKQQALNYMLDHSYRFFSNNFTGSLTQRISRYQRAFEFLADQIIYSFIPIVIRIGGVFVVLMFIARPIALILATLVLIYMVINFVFSRWKLKYNIELSAMDSHATGVLSDVITNHTTIQLFTGSETE